MWWPGDDRDADRIPLSAIEHYAYCPRQAALIHLDGIYDDNTDTVRGTIAHQKVHTPSPPSRAATGPRIITGVPVWSARLRLYGVCDAVEISAASVVPVEHKVGPYLPHGPADIQAAAQAVCLREMLGANVPHAEVFSYADRRRHRVVLTSTLLDQVEGIATRLHDLLAGTALPPAVNDKRCPRCSLRHQCLPRLVTGSQPTHLFAPIALGSWDA
jgi:CRISPR-associated exonuclease Cas4